MLVLGAGAVETVGLKTITARHLGRHLHTTCKTASMYMLVLVYLSLLPFFLVYTHTHSSGAAMSAGGPAADPGHQTTLPVETAPETAHIALPL